MPANYAAVGVLTAAARAARRRQTKYAGIPLEMIPSPISDGPGRLIKVFATNQTATATNTIGVTG